MEKILNFIQRLIDGIISFFKIVLTGKIDRPSSAYPRERYQEDRLSVAPEVVPVKEQTELSIGADVLPQYRKNKSILTFRERILFSALRKAVGDEYLIMAKVRMGDFIWLANEPKDRKSHVNQILCKHVDFLLCSKLRLGPVLVIELDDPSHQWPGHEERDKFKDDTFTAIGLPFLRIRIQDVYLIPELRAQIHERISTRLHTQEDEMEEYK